MPERWTFTLPDGRELTPQDGRLQLPTENSTVICQLQITEELDDAPMIAVSAAHSDCVFELDGALVYSPSGRYQEGRFSDDAYEKFAATGQFSMHNMHSGSLLTMIAQFQGEEKPDQPPAEDHVLSRNHHVPVKVYRAGVGGRDDGRYMLYDRCFRGGSFPGGSLEGEKECRIDTDGALFSVHGLFIYKRFLSSGNQAFLFSGVCLVLFHVIPADHGLAPVVHVILKG